MTSAQESEPEPAIVARQGMPGLTIATLAIGVGTVVSAGAGWLSWLIVGLRPGPSTFGWFAYTPLNNRYADFLPTPSYPEFVTLIGPVWFAVLPVASVGLVFARAVRLRETGRVPGLRAGTVAAVAALVLAVAGLVLLGLLGRG